MHAGTIHKAKRSVVERQRKYRVRKRERDAVNSRRQMKNM